MLNSRCEIQLHTGQGENISPSRPSGVNFPLYAAIVLLLLTGFRGYSQTDSLNDPRYDYFLKGRDFVTGFGDAKDKQYRLALFMHRAKALHIRWFIVRFHYEKEIYAFRYARKGDTFHIITSSGSALFQVEKTGWQIINGSTANYDPDYYPKWSFTKAGDCNVEGSWGTTSEVEDP